MIPVQCFRDTPTCDFCGEILGDQVDFQGVNNVIICLRCVKAFYVINEKYEEEKSYMRSHVSINVPVPNHNFKVFEGGKKS